MYISRLLPQCSDTALVLQEELQMIAIRSSYRSVRIFLAMYLACRQNVINTLWLIADQNELHSFLWAPPDSVCICYENLL